MFEARFAILTFTVRYGQYIPVRQVVGTRTIRYREVPPKIDRRRSISAVGGRLREKLGQLREKKRRRRRRGKEKKKRRRKPSAWPRPRTVVALAHSSQACRRPRITRTRARRWNVSPRGEKDRGDVASFL
ncbi:hypothetical protein B296_00053966, partial [Ensete ventricosum]